MIKEICIAQFFKMEGKSSSDANHSILSWVKHVLPKWKILDDDTNLPYPIPLLKENYN